jgi:hypothetical protein
MAFRGEHAVRADHAGFALQGFYQSPLYLYIRYLDAGPGTGDFGSQFC